MGKLLVLFIILCMAGFVIHTYLETGRWSLLPVTLTPQEQELRSLEKELKKVEFELGSYDRQAREIGLAVSQAMVPEKERLLAKKAELELRISDLKRAMNHP